MNRGIFVVLCALSFAPALERAAAGKRYNEALKRAFGRDEPNP
jgi:hypothetical protein